MILITGTENPGPSMSALWHSWSAETAEPAPSTSYLFFTWCDSALMEKWGLYLFFFFFCSCFLFVLSPCGSLIYSSHEGKLTWPCDSWSQLWIWGNTQDPLSSSLTNWCPIHSEWKGKLLVFFIHSKSLACVINKHNKCLFSKIWGFFCNFYTLMIIKASSN